MPDDVLKDRAALYVSGALTAAERESFEWVLLFHQEIRAHVAGLQQTMAAVALSEVGQPAVPPAGLRDRIFASLDAQPTTKPDAVVATDPAGRVRWINPAFTAMCGYELSELEGRKPGSVLQGPGTDAEAVARIREALAARRACTETLINYHKDGSPYRVEVRIEPVLDDDREPLWFVARERLLATAAELAGR